LGLGWACATAPREPPAPVAAPPGAFQGLQALAGEWRRTPEREAPFTVAYRLLSAGTVLAEAYGAGSPHETMTVFHPDRAGVLATHYCAQGNQPRLDLVNTAPGHWIFQFRDATNLPDANASHLVRLELRLSPDRSQLTRIETYQENGKADTSTLELARPPP
jgi:hypothetical protein